MLKKKTEVNCVGKRERERCYYLKRNVEVGVPVPVSVDGALSEFRHFPSREVNKAAEEFTVFRQRITHVIREKI